MDVFVTLVLSCSGLATLLIGDHSNNRILYIVLH